MKIFSILMFFALTAFADSPPIKDVFKMTGGGQTGLVNSVSGVLSPLAPGTPGNCLVNSGGAWVSGACTAPTALTFTSPLVLTGSTVSIPASTNSVNGYLTSADHTSFASKQAAGNYITALTGDVTATGPGSVASTLATVNSSVGSFTNANVTVDAKGRVTAASNGSSGGTPGGLNLQIQYNNAGVFGGDTAVTNGSGGWTATSLALGSLTANTAITSDSTKHLVSTTIGNLIETGSANLVVTGGTSSVLGSGVSLALTGASIVETTSSVLALTGATNAVLGTGVSIQVKQAATAQSGYLSSTDWNTFNGKQAGPLTGDVTTSGAASTLATVNSNVGSFTNANITVNAKGLITAAANGSGGGGSITIGDAVGSSNPLSVLTVDASNNLANDPNFIWDAANQRLGVGNPTPAFALDVGLSTGATSYDVNVVSHDEFPSAYGRYCITNFSTSDHYCFAFYYRYDNESPLGFAMLDVDNSHVAEFNLDGSGQVSRSQIAWDTFGNMTLPELHASNIYGDASNTTGYASGLSVGAADSAGFASSADSANFASNADFATSASVASNAAILTGAGIDVGSGSGVFAMTWEDGIDGGVFNYAMGGTSIGTTSGVGLLVDISNNTELTGNLQVDSDSTFLGTIQVDNSINSAIAQVSIGGSTSGSATFSQPFQGTSYKKIIVYLSALVGTASYTYSTSFSHAPVVLSTSGLATAIVTSVGTSSMTVTGTNTTGILILEGF